jgi:hypothetical protein
MLLNPATPPGWQPFNPLAITDLPKSRYLNFSAYERTLVYLSGLAPPSPALAGQPISSNPFLDKSC